MKWSTPENICMRYWIQFWITKTETEHMELKTIKLRNGYVIYKSLTLKLRIMIIGCKERLIIESKAPALVH